MSEIATHSRRAALGAVAGMTSFVLPLAATATTLVLTDPAFAAIDRHRSALDAFREAIRRSNSVAAELQGREVSQADEDATDAAMEAEEDALFAALSAPTTIAGFRAILQYFERMKGDAFPNEAREVAELLLRSPFLAA